MATKMHADAGNILLSIELLEKVYVCVCVVPYLTLGKDLRL